MEAITKLRAKMNGTQNKDESKDEWNTKEGTGKSMKNALHVQQCDKRYFSG